MESKDLEEIVEEAKKSIPSALKNQPDADAVRIPVMYPSDPQKPVGPDDKTVTYNVKFKMKNASAIFESIEVN